MPKILLSLIILLYCTRQTAYSQTNTAAEDSTHVLQSVHSFVDAFTRLDWNKFTDCFADDATAFFPPSAKFPARPNNKPEITSSPPYLTIDPIDLKIQILGSVAVVTFLLNDPGLLGRRTIVFKKENDQWLIVHLHASGVTP